MISIQDTFQLKEIFRYKLWTEKLLTDSIFYDEIYTYSGVVVISEVCWECNDLKPF